MSVRVDTTEDRFPVALIGPGAVGCALLGGLISKGHHPVVAARTRIGSVSVTTPELGVESVVRCLADRAEAVPADLVLLAVKAHQTAGTEPWLDALVDDDTTIVICQNGVEHLDRIRPIVRSEPKMVPAVVNMPCRRSAPGVCEVTGRSTLTVPPGPGGDRLADALDGSFIEVARTDDWTTAAWTKLMVNAASGGIGALTRTDNRLFSRDREAARFAIDVMGEVAAVGRAEGANLPDGLAERLLDRLARAAPGHMSSIVVDRIEGLATEWDARNAVIGRIGRRHGIPTPLNDALTTLLRTGEPTP